MNQIPDSINKIIVHCCGESEGFSDCKGDEKKEIDFLHKIHTERGFRKIGYHVVVTSNGCMFANHEFKQVDSFGSSVPIQDTRLRAFNEVGAHCLDHNVNSLGVCVVGDLTKSGLFFKTGSLNNLVHVLDAIISEEFPHLDEGNIYPHWYFDIKGKTCPNINLMLNKHWIHSGGLRS